MLHRELRPDVMLLDLQMPKVDGIGAAEQILADCPSAKIIILTSFEKEEEIHRALQVGVKGYLLKESKLPELAEAIRTIHRGGRWIPVRIARLVKERETQPRLTKREAEVLDLVAKGFSNKEIAEILGFTEDGAKHHMRSIFAKLGVTARTEAVSEGLKRGIIRQP